MNERNRARLGGSLIILFFLSLTGAFLALHLAFPSDGARLEPGQSVWASDGIIVTPLEERPGRLLRGDIVTAVDGRSLEEWARAIFQPGLAHPPGLSSQAPVYTVIRHGQRLEFSPPLALYPLGAILAKNWSAILFTFFTQLVMTFVFFVKPGDRATRVLFLWAWCLSHTYAWSLGLQMSDIVNGLGFWLYQLSASGAWLIFWGAGLEFTLIFPRDHRILHQRPWLLPAVYLAPFALFLAYLAIARVMSPTTLDWLGRWIVGNWLIAFVFQSLSAYFVLDGYRSSHDPVHRRKVRWLVFAFVLCGGVGLSLWFIPGILLGQPLIDANVLGLSLLPYPVILAIAVLRYQLFDIDVIIRRTLVYSTLTATLALVYYCGIVVLQSAFAAFGGGRSELATVVSTLTIAALFFPLRSRIQNFIDRRFYRQKYDAQKVLAEFATAARDETDLGALTARLVEVVDETMQPETVSVWLNPMGGRAESRLTADGR